MLHVRWSGFGVLSAILLMTAMIAATLLLRPIFLQHGMPLHAAAWLADGLGLLIGAAINLPLARWMRDRPSGKRHSFMGLGMQAWSVIGAIGGIALIIASHFQAQ